MNPAFGSKALMAGLAGAAACMVGAFLGLDQFFRSYLFAYIFWLGVALGCLSILMIQHITGGTWGLVIRRLLESGARTLPVMALLFVPILLGLHSLYPWARPEEVAGSELLQHKAPYLNVTFVVARTILYFVVWIALVAILDRYSRRQEATGDPGLPRRMQVFSAGGLVLFILTMTFASVDWVMSLEPEWFSTIYGILLMAGQVVSAFCVVIAAVIILSRAKPLSEILTADVLNDLGKLLFAFVMVWAYFALSQFLIIWSGNLPEEIPWYLRRMKGGWEWVGLSIILFHFALPFFLLMMRTIKRDPTRLMRVALLIFVMRVIDLYWMMVPAGADSAFGAHWMDLAALVGVGGIWLFLFARQAGRYPLLPMNDPYLKEAMEQAHD